MKGSHPNWKKKRINEMKRYRLRKEGGKRHKTWMCSNCQLIRSVAHHQVPLSFLITVPQLLAFYGLLGNWMKKKVNLSARCSNMNVPQNYEEIVTNCYFFFLPVNDIGLVSEAKIRNQNRIELLKKILIYKFINRKFIFVFSHLRFGVFEKTSFVPRIRRTRENDRNWEREIESIKT